MPNELTETLASGMTLNERLWHTELMGAFDRAVAQADEQLVRSILAKVYFTPDQIEGTVTYLLKKPTARQD